MELFRNGVQIELADCMWNKTHIRQCSHYVDGIWDYPIYNGVFGQNGLHICCKSWPINRLSHHMPITMHTFNTIPAKIQLHNPMNMGKWFIRFTPRPAYSLIHVRKEPADNNETGPRLNIETVFTGYRDFHTKDKTVVWDRLIFNMAIPKLVRRLFYIETAPLADWRLRHRYETCLYTGCNARHMLRIIFMSHCGLNQVSMAVADDLVFIGY